MGPFTEKLYSDLSNYMIIGGIKFGISYWSASSDPEGRHPEEQGQGRTKVKHDGGPGHRRGIEDHSGAEGYGQDAHR